MFTPQLCYQMSLPKNLDKHSDYLQQIGEFLSKCSFSIQMKCLKQLDDVHTPTALSSQLKDSLTSYVSSIPEQQLSRQLHLICFTNSAFINSHEKLFIDYAGYKEWALLARRRPDEFIMIVSRWLASLILEQNPTQFTITTLRKILDIFSASIDTLSKYNPIRHFFSLSVFLSLVLFCFFLSFLVFSLPALLFHVSSFFHYFIH